MKPKKITVKHYLNKTLKKQYLYDTGKSGVFRKTEFGYRVYMLVTYNRKVTRIPSPTLPDHYTEAAFASDAVRDLLATEAAAIKTLIRFVTSSL